MSDRIKDWLAVAVIVAVALWTCYGLAEMITYAVEH